MSGTDHLIRQRIVHGESRATAKQARYLTSLERQIPREAADAVYLRVIGVHRIHVVPAARYCQITRQQASDLIESYNRAREIKRSK